jgi:hypothetical protein
VAEPRLAALAVDAAVPQTCQTGGPPAVHMTARSKPASPLPGPHRRPDKTVSTWPTVIPRRRDHGDSPPGDRLPLKICSRACSLGKDEGKPRSPAGGDARPAFTPLRVKTGRELDQAA